MNRPTRQTPWCYPLPCDYCGQYGCECTVGEILAARKEGRTFPAKDAGTRDEPMPPERGAQDDEC